MSEQDKTSESKKPAPTMAFHASNEDGSKQVVGIGNLRVMILQAGKFWFAQGMEIDYAVQGNTIEETKERFGAGLRATIHEHLTMYGNIKGILEPAPKDAWEEFYACTGKSKATFFQISMHDMFPYDNIAFYELPKESEKTMVC